MVERETDGWARMSGAPRTSFPGMKDVSGTVPSQITVSEVEVDPDSELWSILINSDASECNENLSIYLKFIIDNIYNEEVSDKERTYHALSIHALKLLTSNMFVKNYEFCIGKIIAFLSTFTALAEARYEESNNNSGSASPEESSTPQSNISMDQVNYETDCLKEFLCIILLLLLKIKNDTPSKETQSLNSIDDSAIFQTLRKYNFVTVISDFITCNVIHMHVPELGHKQKSSSILLKFSCDILFEYFYHTELLTDTEFEDLTNKTRLIPTLIKYLLSNERFNQYDIDGDELEDEDKLNAYEEFKLLLFINEQYLMKSYSCSVRNKVFEGLMYPDEDQNTPDSNDENNASKITGFINLLIYNLNREDSRIIKILILKFLYLIFTTSYTTKLIYMNDLRILVEIFIRDMNNLDYTDEIENVILILTYLKVLFPMLSFSQLSEDESGYKKQELVELLGNIVMNMKGDLEDENTLISESQRKQKETISKLATKCMSINWLVENTNGDLKVVEQENIQDHASSEDEDKPHNDSTVSLESLDISLTRVASVRTSTRSDFYNHTTTQTGRRMTSLVEENNNNVFMSKNLNSLTISETSEYGPSPWITSDSNRLEQPLKTNLLDLSTDYLNAKPLPKVPIPKHSRQTPQFYKNDASSSSSVNSASSLVRKALKKKAPPPPPVSNSKYSPVTPPPQIVPMSKHSSPGKCTPPPPPPPRRRR